MSKFAWVTLATNDSYSLGALVLAHSLKRVSTAHQCAVLVTPGVSDAMREKLATVFDIVQEVNVLDSQDSANLALLARPELGITFTKLHCWRLVQFDKCVFLDADTLVLKNCDELFEREEFSAAPDVGWPDCFNSGVFVYRPSMDTFGKLIEFAIKQGSFDGGDQGLLNLFFSDWAHKDISKHLPFIYNTCSTACYSYLPAFKQFGQNVKIMHFIGNNKPWLQSFDTKTGNVDIPAGSQHVAPFLQYWWTLFFQEVHSKLTSTMLNSSQPPHISGVEFIRNTTVDMKTNEFQFNCIPVDPWDNYCPGMATSTSANQTEEELMEEKSHEGVLSKLKDMFNWVVNRDHDSVGGSTQSDEMKQQPSLGSNEVPATASQAMITTTEPPHCSPPNYIDDVPQAGIAGALANLTLGSSKTPEQEAYEHMMRRQCWEAGNIDYMGKDSFDNIWRRISKTIETQPQTVAAAAPAEAASAEPQQQTPSGAAPKTPTAEAEKNKQQQPPKGK